MTSLVDFVRPFQTRDVTPPVPAPSSDNGTPVDDTVITLGESGSAKLCDYALSQTVTHYTTHRPKEKKASRQTHVKRITNPDDASQFVDVEVIDKIRFYDPANRGQETEFTVKNEPDDTDDDIP